MASGYAKYSGRSAVDFSQSYRRSDRCFNRDDKSPRRSKDVDLRVCIRFGHAVALPVIYSTRSECECRLCSLLWLRTCLCGVLAILVFLCSALRDCDVSAGTNPVANLSPFGIAKGAKLRII